MDGDSHEPPAIEDPIWDARMDELRTKIAEALVDPRWVSAAELRAHFDRLAEEARNKRGS